MGKRSQYKNQIFQHGPSAPINTFIPEAEIDFHLLGRLTPYDIEKILSEFLEDSFVNNLSRLLVITGKGQVVKPTVENFLKKSKFVRSYQQAGYFNGQQGAFEVRLKSSV